MKLKRIIKYLLHRQGVPDASFAHTTVSSIALSTTDEDVSFSYVSPSSTIQSVSYDNTVDFQITVGGATGNNAVVLMTSTNSRYNIKADLRGELHVHVLDGPYLYAVYGTAMGITSATGSFTAPTSATISVAA